MPRLQVGPPEIEVPDPGIQKRVRLRQEFDRLARVPVFQSDVAFDDLGVGLRLVLQFGAKAGDQGTGPGDVARLDKRSGRQEPDLHRLAVHQRFVDRVDRGAFLRPRELCVGNRRKLRRRPGRDSWTPGSVAAPCPRIRTASEKRPSIVARSPSPDAAKEAPSSSMPASVRRFLSPAATAPGTSWAKARATAAYASGSGIVRASFSAVWKSPA